MPGRKQAARSSSVPKRKAGNWRYWSGAVTRNRNVLDLEPSVFRRSTPKEVAQSLNRSAEASRRRKGTPYQSAISMLTFTINRAGRNLPKSRLNVLNRTKRAVRDAFGRT